ncbi:MAG TPA: OmpA family protein [Candidatus Brocadiaceae bacterium]|nr:OmpA family protein [Candidatus Brocadiaceae bacterium]
MSSGHSKHKKKKHGGSGTPDLFWTSYGSLITILLAFFIIFQVNFTENTKKEFIDEFKKSVERSRLTLGMGGILPGWDTGATVEDIHKMKYIYQEYKAEPGAEGKGGLEQYGLEEDQIPAAVVIYFEENDASITMDGKHALNKLIDLIGERPCSLVIEGHTGQTFAPSPEYGNCWKLSLDRAQAVADYLYKKGTISHKRMITVGYGNNRPVVTDVKGDKANDRVSIIIGILK